MDNGNEDRDTIRDIIVAINLATVQGQFHELGPYLHPNMSIAGPDFKRIAAGRAACIQYYRDFQERAQISAFKADEVIVDVTGFTAVATFRFSMTYELKGETRTEDGGDILAFTKETGQWQVSWRTYVK